MRPLVHARGIEVRIMPALDLVDHGPEIGSVQLRLVQELRGRDFAVEQLQRYGVGCVHLRARHADRLSGFPASLLDGRLGHLDEHFRKLVQIVGREQLRVRLLQGPYAVDGHMRRGHGRIRLYNNPADLPALPKLLSYALRVIGRTPSVSGAEIAQEPTVRPLQHALDARIALRRHQRSKEPVPRREPMLHALHHALVLRSHQPAGLRARRAEGVFDHFSGKAQHFRRGGCGGGGAEDRAGVPSVCEHVDAVEPEADSRADLVPGYCGEEEGGSVDGLALCGEMLSECEQDGHDD